jgi:uncharacterized protein
MPPLSVMIKPASSNCNLRCKYCFYHSLAENRLTRSYGIMNFSTLEAIVSKALEFADGTCTIAFQGGEPTIAGLDFFKTLVSLEKKYNKKNLRINNSIQTNGVAIDDRWAEFLASNRFLVGISLDGTKDVHDSNRIDSKDKGTFNRVMNTIDLFNKHKVDYNILTVVNAFNSRHAAKMYNFFKRNGFRYQQYIPCLDPLGEKPGGYSYSLTPGRYGNFLKDLFDLWYADVSRGEMVSIRYFDNLVGMIAGFHPEVCGMTGVCNCQFVIEADGGVYPCDFYVTDEWRLGSIVDKGFDELKSCATAQEFVKVSAHVDPACLRCPWASLCRGGCRRNREPFTAGFPSLNYYCSSFKSFFEYSAARLHRLAAMFASRTR